MTSLSSSPTPLPVVCSNEDDDALLAAALASLSVHDALDPSWLSPLVPSLPFDVLVLVVSEVDHADLPAWCLASAAFDRIARPLLWREVSFADNAVMRKVLAALYLPVFYSVVSPLRLVTAVLPFDLIPSVFRRWPPRRRPSSTQSSSVSPRTSRGAPAPRCTSCLRSGVQLRSQGLWPCTSPTDI